MLSQNSHLRLPARETAYLASLGMTPDMLGITPLPRVNLTESDLTKLRGINADVALSKYRELSKIPRRERDVQGRQRGVYSMNESLSSMTPPELLEQGRSAGLDAFELQMLARGLAVRGENAALIDAIVTLPANRALYPEFVRRVMIETPIGPSGMAQVSQLIAASETIVGGSVIAPKISDMTGPARSKTGERAGLPRRALTTTSVSKSLHKYGVVLAISYEAARSYSLNLFNVFVGRERRQFEVNQVSDLIDLIYTSATNGGDTAAVGKLTPMDMATQISRSGDAGYYVNRIVMPSAMYELYIQNSAVWDPIALSFMRDRTLPPFQGADILKAPSASTSLGTTKILYQDAAQSCVEFIEAGSEIAEVTSNMETQEHIYPFSVNKTWMVLLDGAARYQTLKT